MTPDFHRSIRVLQLEGDVRDAEQVQLQLFTTGLWCSIQRVDTREAFLASLRQCWPDVIVFGRDVPALDGAAALEIVRREAPHVPVVFAVMDRLEALADDVQGALVQARGARERRIAAAAKRHQQLRIMRATWMESGSLVGLLPLCAESSAPSPTS